MREPCQPAARTSERATARRAAQLADTALVDYQASAHGYLTFLAQLGEGFPEPPKIVKADELALEVYWRSPDLSKQRIVGRRDTLLLPTDINYHRDHLGIVQNNFPNIVRLGDGDEVRDVPHPLSLAGLAIYDYAISDSLKIQLPDRAIDVLEVRLRPKNDRVPAAVGAVYIDREQATVVRMAFSFTRAALIDKQLEDVSIVLENALGNDFVFVEGQGSLLHPGYSGVTLGLLHGSQPDAMVLVHQPTRIRTLNDEIEIMPLPDWIELHERMAGYLKPAPVVGVAINGYDLDEAAARDWAERITAETGLPAVDPVKFGAEPLVEAVLAAPTGKARPSAAARGVAR